MKKKKILHILHSEIGGAGEIAFTINDLDNSNFLSEYLLTGPKLFSGFKTKIKKIKKKLIYYKIEKGNHLLKIFNIFNKIKNINPDIIIIHNYQILPCLLIKFFHHKKIIYIDHMSFSLKKFKDYFSIFLSFIFFNKIIFINDENYKKFRFFKKKTKIIYNSISDIFKSKTKNKSKKTMKIGIAGRINPLKFHDLIVDVLKNDKILQKKIKIYIAGSGESKKKLMRKVKLFNLNKIIIFSGELDQENLKKWFQKINLYLHPSLGEGMSTSILQAISSSTPVLASNVRGINNFIGKKKYMGLLFENNVEDLRQKITYFINLSNKDYLMFQKIQKKHFLKYHNLSIFHKKYNKVINSL